MTEDGDTSGHNGQRTPAPEPKRSVNFTQLAKLTLEDPLTGLVNQLLLHDRLGQTITRIKRRGERVVVFYVDINGFQRVNEEYGFEIGNAVLCELARRLGAIIRSEDTLSRVGGDEFVAVLAIESEQSLGPVTVRVQSAFEGPIVVEGATVTLSASIGVVMGDGSDSAQHMLLAADEAMYAQKSEKRPPS